MTIHHQQKLSLVRADMQALELDAYFVPRADEYLGEYVPAQNERLQWISGFTGSAGAAVILQTSAAIFVDGRYKQVGCTPQLIIVVRLAGHKATCKKACWK